MTTTTHELQVPNRLTLTPGREFTATGIRGRLRFHRGVLPDNGEPWADAYDKDGRYRSIRISRIRRVHRQCKTRPAQGLRPQPRKTRR